MDMIHSPINGASSQVTATVTEYYSGLTVARMAIYFGSSILQLFHLNMEADVPRAVSKSVIRGRRQECWHYYE